MEVIGSWSRGDLEFLLALVAGNGDSLGSALDEFVGTWSGGLVFAEVCSLPCPDFDLAAGLGLETEFVGSRAWADAANIVVPLSPSNFGPRHGSGNPQFIGTRARPVDRSGLFAEFLADCAPLHSRVAVFVNLVLAWAWLLVQSCVGFEFVAETVFGACAERSALGVLARAGVEVSSAQSSPFGSAYFGPILLELRAGVVSTWSGLRVLDPVSVFGTHSEGRRVFIDSVSGDIIISGAGG